LGDKTWVVVNADEEREFRMGLFVGVGEGKCKLNEAQRVFTGRDEWYLEG